MKVNKLLPGVLSFLVLMTATGFEVSSKQHAESSSTTPSSMQSIREGTSVETIVLDRSEASLAPRQSTLLSAEKIYTVGYRGGYIWELQGRLKHLGYYTGPINGVFDKRTYLAVRLFQYRFGLRVDGKVGATTRAKLWKASQRYRAGQVSPSRGGAKTRTSTGIRRVRVKNSNNLNRGDINLLARAVYAEARGEPFEGQVAVAAVILNRLRSTQFPHTISGIIYEPLAFTSVADGQINLNPNQKAFEAASDAINGWDPSRGALYYFNPVTSTSKWIWSRPEILKIGKHIFAE